MTPTRIAAIFLLLAVAGFGWGMAMVTHEVFPWSIVKPIHDDLSDFLAGHSEEDTTWEEKLVNDLNISPRRQITAPTIDPQRSYQPLSIERLAGRRGTPQVFHANGAQTGGYRFVFGTFDFQEHLHGAILLDDRDRVVHTWRFNEAPTYQRLQARKAALAEQGKTLAPSQQYDPPEQRFPHGVELYPDGSIIFNEGDSGNAIQRMDFCGNPRWLRLGRFHHTVQKDETGNSVWAFHRHNLANLDAETGDILREIPWDDVIAANPDVHLSLRVDLESGKVHHDPWHGNDIHPLPPRLASAFPQFTPGDLLVSYRSLNLVAVVDPDTLRIKWWRVGASRRQHDPDWEPDGRISIYNNNMRFRETDASGKLQDKSHRHSSIVAIDPATYAVETLYDGARDHFYSAQRGKHQMLPNGNILITSPQQGRVLEVTPAGETVYEIQNIYDEHLNLLLSEAIWVPEDFFTFDVTDSSLCGNPVTASARHWPVLAIGGAIIIVLGGLLFRRLRRGT